MKKTTIFCVAFALVMSFAASAGLIAPWGSPLYVGGEERIDSVTIVRSTIVGTNVSGYLMANTTWNLAGSPYVVEGDVIVTDGTILTIEPGVVVRFTNGTSLLIDGSLVADGNSTNQITFTSDATIPKPGDWGGIHLRNYPSTLSNFIVEYANVGIRFDSVGNASFLQVTSNVEGIEVVGGMDLYNMVIENNTDCGLLLIGGDMTLTNSSVSNNKIGIKGNYGGIDGIYNCTISNNSGDGIFVDGTPINYLLNSRIIGNGGRGISVNRFLSDCANTTVSNNLGGGIYMTQWTVGISNCSISMNVGYGVSSDSHVDLLGSIISNNSLDGVLAGNAQIQYCSILDNGKAGVNAGGGIVHFCNLLDKGPYEVIVYGNNQIDATENWWGTANVTLIKERVYDYFKDPNLGIVSCDPFLNSTQDITAIPIPEFQSLVPLSCFMTLAIFAVLILRRRTVRIRFSSEL